MTLPDFITAAQAARAREAQAEARIEQIKRALEAAIAAEGSGGFAARGPVGRYCSRIGLEVRLSKGAGVEFGFASALKLAEAIERAPVPDALRRYLKDKR